MKRSDLFNDTQSLCLGREELTTIFLGEAYVGKYGARFFIGNLANGASVSVRVNMPTVCFVRVLELDPRQAKFQNCMSRQHEKNYEHISTEFPEKDPWATIPAGSPHQADPFELNENHTSFDSEVWPSLRVEQDGTLRHHVQTLLADSNEDQRDDSSRVKLELVTKEGNLGYFSKPYRLVKLSFLTSARYNQFTNKYFVQERKKDDDMRVLRPFFRDGYRYDLFHDEFKPFLVYLVERGLRLHQPCQVKVKKMERGKFTKCTADLEISGDIRAIQGELTHYVDNSVVCYYHVGVQTGPTDFWKDPSRHPVTTICCFFKQHHAVDGVVFTTRHDFVVPSFMQQRGLKVRVQVTDNEHMLIIGFLRYICDERDVDILMSMDGMTAQMHYLYTRLGGEVHFPEIARVLQTPQLQTPQNGRKRERQRHVKKSSLHHGDRDYMTVDIPGVTQLDIMDDLAHSRKLMLATQFTVLDDVIAPKNKVPAEAWASMENDFPHRLEPVENGLFAFWLAWFVLQADVSSSVIQTYKSFSGLTNVPVPKLLTCGEFLKVNSLFYTLNPQFLYCHSVDLLREDWPFAQKPDNHNNKGAKDAKLPKIDEDDEGLQQEKLVVGAVRPVRKPHITGGNNIPPNKGFYEDLVPVNDFKSLYPSIMSDICLRLIVRSAGEARALMDMGLTVIASTSVIDAVLRQTAVAYFVVGTSRTTFISNTAIMLSSRRSGIKKKMELAMDPHVRQALDIEQNTTKRGNNAIFGVIALYYAPYSAVITSRGRCLQSRLMRKGTAVTHLRMQQGRIKTTYHGTPVFGDTDCVDFYLKKINARQRRELGIPEDAGLWAEHDSGRLKLGQGFEQYLPIREAYFKHDAYFTQEFSKGCTRPIELESDGIMVRVVADGKKRYAGKLYTNPHKWKMKVQGLESVKHDRPPVMRDTVSGMLTCVTVQGDYVGAVNLFWDTLTRLKTGNLPLSAFYVTGEVKIKSRENKDATATAHVVEELFQKTGRKEVTGGHVGFVRTKFSHKKEALNYTHRFIIDSVDNVSTKWYRQELGNIVAKIFGVIFGEQALLRLAQGQKHQMVSYFAAQADEAPSKRQKV